MPSYDQLSDEALIQLIQQQSGNIGSPFQPKGLLGRHFAATTSTEEQIATRPSSIQFLKHVVKKPEVAKQHPFMTGLSTVGAPLEAAESIPANIGLGIQQLRPMKQIVQDVLAGVTGKRPAQLGDIARASGIPVLSSRPVAATVGLGAALGPGLFTKMGQKAATRVSEEVVGHARGVGSLATVSSRAKLAQRISDIPDVAREALSKRFGSAIDEAAAKQVADPSLLFDLQEVGRVLQPVKNQLATGVRHAGSELVTLLAEEPTIGTNIGINEARVIKAGIQRVPEINRPTEAGRILRHARDLIRAQEVDKLGLGKQFGEFKKGMDAVRQVSARAERLGVSAPVTSGLKNLTEAEAARKSYEHLAKVGGQRQTFAEMLGAARAAGMQRAAGRAARYAIWPLAAAGGAFLGAKRLFTSRD